MHVSQPPEAIFDWMLHVSLGETFNGPLTKDFGKPPILATLWLCPWSIGKTCASLEPFHQGLYASAFTLSSRAVCFSFYQAVWWYSKGHHES